MIKLAFKWTWRAFVIATPLLGVWLASSLAVFLGGPRWAALAAGLLAFPIVPFAWEAYAARRKAKRDRARKDQGKTPRKAILKASDRVVLRTLLVNLAFLGALVGLFPQAVFPALSTRGAWFLEAVAHPQAGRVRSAIFEVASHLEWLYKVTHPNPYEKLAEGDEAGRVKPDDIRPGDVDQTLPDAKKPSPPDTNKPAPPDTKKPPDAKKPAPPDVNKPPDAKKPSPPDTKPPRRVATIQWPQAAAVHPQAKAASPEREWTVETLGAHFKRIQSPNERIRAMHDWVATNISYDLPAIADGSYPHRQSAAQVLRARRGVCAGYANLMRALGQVTGDRIVTVTGHTRTKEGEAGGANGHAWNAVKIGGAWYLLDVTWDSGRKIGRKSEPMTTTYFLTPPKVFALDHFPDDPKWQLVKTPLTRGAFLRQPPMDPLSAAYAITVRSPDTGRGISDSATPSLKFHNPRGFFLLGEAEHESGRKSKCKTTRASTSEVNCTLSTTGRYLVRVYANAKRAGRYAYMGAVVVDRR